jgi:hypothetical protein
VWAAEGELLLSLDKFMLTDLKINLAELYFKLQEPDLAKIVLKKISENSKSRQEAAQLWKQNDWYPFHAAYRYHTLFPRDPSAWREYVRFGRTIGFNLEDKDGSGTTVEQLLRPEEKDSWLALFSGSAAPVSDPWAN